LFVHRLRHPEHLDVLHRVLLTIPTFSTPLHYCTRCVLQNQTSRI
jgi:hypothetical protein